MVLGITVELKRVETEVSILTHVSIYSGQYKPESSRLYASKVMSPLFPSDSRGHQYLVKATVT